jgi:hypothetical protein
MSTIAVARAISPGRRPPSRTGSHEIVTRRSLATPESGAVTTRAHHLTASARLRLTSTSANCADNAVIPRPFGQHRHKPEEQPWQ